jgi:hypothetical protein
MAFYSVVKRIMDTSENRAIIDDGHVKGGLSSAFSHIFSNGWFGWMSIKFRPWLLDCCKVPKLAVNFADYELGMVVGV